MEEQVAFTCGSDHIFGVLHLPKRTPAPGIIMCHGFTGHKAEAHRLFVKAARDFAQHGLAVLRFDFRGSGDSGGDFREMTISREIEDASAALDSLTSRAEVDANRAGVLGLSLGGCVAACLAGQDTRVRALVLWAAAAHPERINQGMLTDPNATDVLDMHGWGLGRGFVEDAQRINPLKTVGGYAGPSLVVHGAQDEVVPPSEAADYRLALGGKCRVHLVEGADHVFSSLDYEAEAFRVSRDFLVEALGG